MADLSVITQMKPKPWLLVSLTFVCLFAPGISALALFIPDMVRGLDTLKLLMLSAALTLPLVLVNTHVARVVYGFGNGAKDVEASLMIGLAITTLISGVVLCIWFLLEELGARPFVAAVATLEFVLYCSSPILKRRQKLRAEEQKAMEEVIIS